MGPLTDIYVLASKRSRSLVEKFQSVWMVGFVESADEYYWPSAANYDQEKPTEIFHTAAPLLKKLLENPTEEYGIYWRNERDEMLTHGMMFFTSDGGLIMGLSLAYEISLDGVLELGTMESPSPLTKTFVQLAESVEAKFGYTLVEQPPAFSKTEEFIAESQTYALAPRLVDGVLILKDCSQC